MGIVLAKMINKLIMDKLFNKVKFVSAPTSPNRQVNKF